MRKRLISPADVLTMGNVVCGIIAIWYLIEKQFLWGCALLILAMVFDSVDGYVARRFGSSHKAGAYLDSIADSISFALAPAIAIYAAFYDLNQPGALTFESRLNTMTVVVSLAIALAGIFRLARFTKSQKDVPHFIGLPTPIATGMVVFLILLFGPTYFDGYFGLTYSPPLVLAGTLVIAALEISPIPFPKVRGKVVVPFAAALVLAGFVPALSYPLFYHSAPHTYELLAVISSCCVLFVFLLYLAVCPILVKVGWLK